MACHAWPGNVRELDNRVQRALMLSDGDTLELSPRAPAGHVTVVTPASVAPGALRSFHDAREDSLQQFERDYLRSLMQLADGNVTHAARLAGKERRALGKLLKKHGLERRS
jgi:DNA-binding NtrC family response regulator